jgi:O-succinylbenzoic acid--CoA ligase
VHRLVALDLPGGPAFVAALRRAWDHGDAVAVVDRRLPPAGRERWLAAVRPHVVVGDDGRERAHDPAAPPVAEGDALVATTSGSTGRPKAVVHTRAGLEAHGRAVHQRLDVDPDRDRWLACLPLGHLGGFGVVARSLLTGTPCDVVDGFDAGAVAAAPAELGTTLVSLVATALDRLDPAPFRWVVLGGSADPVHRPANVVRTYGLTESGGGVVYEGVPLAGTEVRVADDGAISLRGPTVARGRRAAEGEVVPLVDGDGWLATGDLGRWDEDGRLVVAGRADDLIVTGGENVWPAAVEAALATHPGVREVAVVGAPDPEWGHRVVAVVAPVDPDDPPTLEELRDHARATLPGPALPRELRLVDRLARTALGKVVRPHLT